MKGSEEGRRGRKEGGGGRGQQKGGGRGQKEGGRDGEAERWREGAEGGRERGRKVEGGMERQKGGGRGQKEGRRDGEAERWREGAEGRSEGWMERWTAIQLSMLFVCLLLLLLWIISIIGFVCLFVVSTFVFKCPSYLEWTQLAQPHSTRHNCSQCGE